MNTNEPIAALIAAAENMLHTLPLVPTAPLAEAQDFVGRMYRESTTNPGDWPKAVRELADAIEAVDWSFWPPEEYGSRDAYVSIGHLQDVAERLAALKEELGQ